MQRKSLTFLITAILIFAICVCGTIVYSSTSYQTCQSNYDIEKDHISAKQDFPIVDIASRSTFCFAKFIDQHNGLVTAFATIWIAIFTFVLVLVTDKQAKLTKISADAAEKAANAALGVELPTLYVTEVRLQMLGMTSGRKHFLDDDYILSFYVANYGRTPAFLEQVEFYETIAEKLTFPVTDGKDLYVNFPQVIKGDSWVIMEQKTSKNPFSEKEIQDVKNGSASYWIYGHLIFRDFMGNKHKRGFAWRGDEKIKDFVRVQNNPNDYYKYEERKNT